MAAMANAGIEAPDAAHEAQPWATPALATASSHQQAKQRIAHRRYSIGPFQASRAAQQLNSARRYGFTCAGGSVLRDSPRIAGGVGELMKGQLNHGLRAAVELQLRRCSGTAFQAFFSDVMSRAHGNDFVPVRPFGALGDKGCDGFLQSTAEVFQCYGAVNGTSTNVAKLVEKLVADFATAKDKLSFMSSWTFVHNLVDGLPVEAIGAIETLKAQHPGLKIALMGLEGFEQKLLLLPQESLEALIGPLVAARDAQRLQAPELSKLIAALVENTATIPIEPVKIKPVPVDKLEFNNLPPQWRHLITSGWENADRVESFLAAHHDPMVGERIASGFRLRYADLKAQALAPGLIMYSLYEFIAGTGRVSAELQVAAHAILAHLFESCDIFEEPSPGSAP